MKQLSYSEHAGIELQYTNCGHGNLVSEICVLLFIKQWRVTYASVGIAVSIFANHVIHEYYYQLFYQVVFQEPLKTSLYIEQNCDLRCITLLVI
jgi:hypothetical protein